MILDNTTKINIIREEKHDSSIVIAIEPTFPLPQEMRIGIDPGTRNLGMAVVKPEIESVTLYKHTLKRHKNALKRMLDAQKVVSNTLGYFSPNCKVIVEGSAYSKNFREAELSEQRASILLWFYQYGIEAEIVNPLTIRKNVFGNGRIKNPWPEIDDNMIAALACALYQESEK